MLTAGGLPVETPRMRTLILVLSLSVSSLAILGCAGDDDEGGGGTAGAFGLHGALGAG